MKYIKTYEEINTMGDLKKYLLLTYLNDDYLPRIYKVLNNNIKDKTLITIVHDYYETHDIEIIKDRLLFQSDSEEECEAELEIYRNKKEFNI